MPSVHNGSHWMSLSQTVNLVDSATFWLLVIPLPFSAFWKSKSRSSDILSVNICCKLFFIYNFFRQKVFMFVMISGALLFLRSCNEVKLILWLEECVVNSSNCVMCWNCLFMCECVCVCVRNYSLLWGSWPVWVSTVSVPEVNHTAAHSLTHSHYTRPDLTTHAGFQTPPS